MHFHKQIVVLSIGIRNNLPLWQFSFLPVGTRLWSLCLYVCVLFPSEDHNVRLSASREQQHLLRRTLSDQLCWIFASILLFIQFVGG